MVTACGALAGTFVGLMLGQMYVTECLAFTSGGFLYFAINSLLSELKKVDDLGELLTCLYSAAVGLYFMYAFALLE